MYNLAHHSQDQVETAFAQIVRNATLSDADVDAFYSHKARVQSSLDASFNVSKYLAIGSIPRGSAMRGTSDLDLLVVLRREDVYWGDTVKSSTTVLNRVREALRRTYPNTDLGRDAQAIVLHFRDGRDVDVVPGWWKGTQANNWPLYMIPDGHGDWMQTAPDTHAKYIAGGHDTSGGKLKSVVKILKRWKESRALDLPLSAFHIELLMTRDGVCAPGKSLSACTADALGLLVRRECRALQDPCGVSGLVQAAGSEAKRDRLFAAAREASSYANAARSAETAGDQREAVRYWNLAFNGKFA